MRAGAAIACPLTPLNGTSRMDPREAAIALGLLAMLVLAVSAVPPRWLVRNALRLRWGLGLCSGLAAATNMALPAMQSVLEPISGIAPVSTAVGMLVFGPAAGLVSAAVVVLAYSVLQTPLAGTGLLAMLATSALAWAAHLLRARGHLLAALLTLALALPLVLKLCMQLGGSLAFSEQLHYLPWRFGLGVLVLGGAIEVLLHRARTIEALHDTHAALRQREQELRMALESVRGGSWEWQVAQQRFHCHGQLYEELGVLDGDPDTLWQRWNALRHPEDAERIAPQLQRNMAGLSEHFEAEFRIKTPTGQWRWLVTQGNVAERDAQGRALRVVGLHLDVTDYRATESALRISQAKYTAIYDTMADPAGITRVCDGRYLEVNPAFCDLLGLTREQVVGRTSVELGIWATDRERPTLMQALQRNGKVERLRLVAQRHGQPIAGLMSARPVQLGGHACLVFVFRDMRQEEQTRNTLLASNRLLQQAGRLARLGSWEDRPGQGIVYWSDTCYAIHGLAPGAPLPQRYIEEFVAPAWRNPMRTLLRKSILEQCEWSIEIEIVRADARLAWVRVRGEPVVDKGRVICVRGVMLDIDDTKRTEQRLRQSEERFARIFQLFPYPIGLTRRTGGQYVDVNPAWEETMGYSRSEALGQSAISLGIYTPAQRAALMEAVGAGGEVTNFEADMTVRSGEQRTVLQSMRSMDFDGQACWLFALHDITERKRSAERVREREELLSLTISAAALGLWDWNLQTGLVSGDSAWRAMRGAASGSDAAAVSWTSAAGPDAMEHIAAELARHTAHPATPFDATWRVSHPDGAARWIRSMGKIVRLDANGRALRMVGVSIDVTAQQAQEEHLQKLAHYDPLTSLPNRVLLAQKLDSAMDHAQRTQTLLGVAYLDLDGFKPVNDRFGHDAGDRLLVIAAARMQRLLQVQGCVARLGGDEFVILLPSLASIADCEQILHEVMESIAAPYTLQAQCVTVTASIGYTLYPQDGADADTLVRHADQAMYAAKQAGRNRFHRFDAAQERAMQQVLQEMAQLRCALAHGQFVLYLQPKVDMRRGTVVGAEALARWQHPQKGLLPPAAFLPLLENTEASPSFGAWVVDAALTLIGQLVQHKLYLPVSINIAAPHLQQPDFAQWMAQQLARHPQVPTGLLEIEITETAALYSIDVVAQTLKALRTLGVPTSLDDFGTGYSSLTYLRRLPLSTLKIDQSFVRDMLTDSGDLAIVQGVVGLAQSFGYSVIAEGVETVEQGERLLQMGCALAQGYGVARPMPVADFIEWSAQWQAPGAWRQ